VSLADFGCAGVVFALLLVYYGVVPGLVGLLLVFPMLLVAFLWATGLGIFLAAVNVRYRDVRYVVPFFVQTLLFVTPVIYAVSLVPARFQRLVYINPMTGVITAVRVELVHQGTVDWVGVAISVAVAVGSFFLGVIYFNRNERRFADVI
jgi:lipopolysaccharide transport system permease protein